MELPRVSLTENPLHTEDPVSSKQSVFESDSWAANRESGGDLRRRRRSRKSTIVERMQEYASDKREGHALIGQDFLSIPYLEFDEEYIDSVGPLLRIIDFFHLFFFGNGKWWIIPCTQLGFLTMNNVYSFIEFSNKNAVTEWESKLFKYSSTLSILLLGLCTINFGSMYLLLKSGHIKRMLLSNCRGEGEQRKFLLILVFLIGLSLVLSFCSSLFYATQVNDFYENSYSIFEDSSPYSYMRFYYVYAWGFLCITLHLYTSFIYCWVCYMMNNTFDSHLLPQIIYKNMSDVSDMIFSFYNRTQVISSFYYYTNILRTIVTVPLTIVYFQTIYYIQDYRDYMKSIKSDLIEYMPNGESLYYRLMTMLTKDLVGNMAAFLLIFAATWSLFIITGLLNDNFRERLVNRLCFILLHTNQENEYNDNESVDDIPTMKEKGGKLTSIEEEENEKKRDDDGDEHLLVSIEKYGDHRETIKDLVSMLNNTNLGLQIGGLLISTKEAISIGTLFVTLIGFVVKLNQS